MRWMGSGDLVKILGAEAMDLAYVSSILSGCIAKTGKLSPMKLPVEINFLTRNPTILVALLFHSSFKITTLPYSLVIFQFAGFLKKG